MLLKLIKTNFVRSCIKVPSNSYAAPSGQWTIYFNNLLITLLNLKCLHFLGIMSLGKSKKKVGKGGPVLEKSELPVETDAKVLVKFVCGSNILKEGQDVELKPDSEYPDWLWNLNTGIILNNLNYSN